MSVVHTLSHASLAPLAAAGAALLPETQGVRVSGLSLEIWTDDAPADAVRCAIEHVEAAWRSRKSRSLAAFAEAQAAQDKADRARTDANRRKRAEIARTLWAEYSRACAEVDAAETRLAALRALLGA